MAAVIKGNEVDPAQLELQLKVWKELAIGKQLLMRTATEALKLDPDCSQEDLKKALDSAIQKSQEADVIVVKTKDEARASIVAMEKKLAAATMAQTIAEAQSAEYKAKLDKSAQDMAVERTALAKEIQQMKERVIDREKAVKAINTALADTPENVLKKMKALKKEKQDEADARREIEASLNAVRKEKREQDQKLKELQDSAAKLITEYRDLHTAFAKAHEQFKGKKDAPDLPELNADIIEAIEDPEAFKKKQAEKEKEKAKDKKRK